VVCDKEMVLSEKYIMEEIARNNIRITGVLHVGAHDCEEIDFYNELFDKSDKPAILWVEGNPAKVKQLENRGIPNVYSAVIGDRDGRKVVFHVANHSQASSILPLGTHATEYYNKKLSFKARIVTLKTFFKNLNASGLENPEKYNYWHLDIQGAELMALRGAGDMVKNADVISIEVNVRETYVGSPLIGDIDDYLRRYSFERVLTKMTEKGGGDALYIKNTSKTPLYKHFNLKLYNTADITKCEYVTSTGLMFLCDIIYDKRAFERPFPKGLSKDVLRPFPKGLSKGLSKDVLRPFPKGLSKGLSKSHITIYVQESTDYGVDSDILAEFVENALPNINQKFVLVTGGSDRTAPLEMLTEEQARRLLANPFLVKWYAQNLLFVHEKVANWPLGLSFNLYREGRSYEVPAVAQEQHLKSLIAQMKPFHVRVADPLKDPLVYVNMTMRNSRLESRWECFNAVYLKDPSLITAAEETLRKLETAAETPRDTVWENISLAPFSLSPYGYGIDCYRNYEILALGAIPIIRGRILHQLFAGMPVLYVDRWEDVTRTLLVETLKKFEKLTFDYSKLKISYWRDLLRTF